MHLKGIVLAFCVFGFFMHLFVTAALIALGYFDFLNLHGLVHSTSTQFHTVLSWNQSTPMPVVQAMESSLSTNATGVSGVFAIVTLLARISFVSFFAYTVLLAYTLWPRRHASPMASKS